MSSERASTSNGFRIKWGNKEIEYFGDSSKDLFITVFEYVKGISSDTSSSAQLERLELPESSTIAPEDSSPSFEAYKLIALDAQATDAQVQKILTFEKRPDFPDFVPMLVSHPKERDAVKLIAYALQVGLRKSLIELSTFKKILAGPNNYQFPGRTLGLILADFRRCNYLSASTAQGRNKPFNLTKEGLDLARDLIRKA